MNTGIVLVMLTMLFVVVLYIQHFILIHSNSIIYYGSTFLFCAIYALVLYRSQCVFYSDFVRITQEIEIAKVYGIKSLFDIYASSPASAIILYAGVLFNNPRIVLVISTVVGTYPYFVIFLKQYQKKIISKTGILYISVLYLLCLSLTSDVFNVRQYISFSLMVLGVYVKTEFGRKYGVIYIIISCLVHFGAIPLAICYMCSSVDKWKKNIIYVLLMFYTFLSTNFIATFQNSHIPFLRQIGNRMSGYYVDSSGFVGYVSDTQSQLFAYIKLFIALCVLIWVSVLKREMKVKFNQQYLNFIYCVVFLCIGSIPTGTPMRRYTVFLMLSIYPLLGICFSIFKKNTSKKTSNLLICYSAIMLIILAIYTILQFYFALKNNINYFII